MFDELFFAALSFKPEASAALFFHRTPTLCSPPRRASVRAHPSWTRCPIPIRWAASGSQRNAEGSREARWRVLSSRHGAR